MDNNVMIPLPEVIASDDIYYQMMIVAYSMRAQQDAAEDEILAVLISLNDRCDPIGATVGELQDYAKTAAGMTSEEAEKEATRLNQEWRWAKTDRAAELTTTENGIVKIKEPPPDLSIIRADELSQMDIDQPLFIVNDILPVGLTLVASPPKYGKSWLMLDLCTAAAMGEPFLGHNTNKCNALYLALEDSEARLKDRITKILRGRGDPPKGCAIATHCMDIEHGLTEQLTGVLDNDPDLKLIVIDTFQKVRSGSKRNENDYAADYRETGALKEIADKYGIAIVLVTHLRKMKDPSDPFSNISGTAGLTGAADTMIVLSRESRMDDNTVMSITGRDVQMEEWYLNFDKEAYRWRIRGTYDDILRDLETDAYAKDPVVLTIKKLLDENPDGWTGRASDFIEASERFRFYIGTTTRSLAKEFKRLRYQLEDNDNIRWDTITHGKGSPQHHFQYGFNPFDDDDADDDLDPELD